MKVVTTYLRNFDVENDLEIEPWQQSGIKRWYAFLRDDRCDSLNSGPLKTSES